MQANLHACCEPTVTEVLLVPAQQPLPRDVQAFPGPAAGGAVGGVVCGSVGGGVIGGIVGESVISDIGGCTGRVGAGVGSVVAGAGVSNGVGDGVGSVVIGTALGPPRSSSKQMVLRQLAIEVALSEVNSQWLLFRLYSIDVQVGAATHCCLQSFREVAVVSPICVAELPPPYRQQPRPISVHVAASGGGVAIGGDDGGGAVGDVGDGVGDGVGDVVATGGGVAIGGKVSGASVGAGVGFSVVGGGVGGDVGGNGVMPPTGMGSRVWSSLSLLRLHAVLYRWMRSML